MLPMEVVGNTGLTLFTEGDALYDAMLDSIERAQRDVCLAVFIFSSDDMGWCFARALVAAAKRGVHVRLQIDAYGSLFYFSRELRKFLKKGGVNLRVFHRWHWKHPLRYNHRDHRKLLVIDEKVAYLGGFNIDARSSQQLSGVKRWRDTHVCVEGSLAQEAGSLFDGVWHFSRLPLQKILPNIKTYFVSKHNFRTRYQIRNLFSSAFKSAQQSIFLATPYFVPDRKTQKGLIDASERGVDVRILLPHKSDIPITRWAARASYANLLHAGVKIYEYQNRVLHSKTMVIDGAWSTVGSANVHTRSFVFNNELNLVSTEPEFCALLSAHFLNDLESSVLIEKSTWPDRSWSERVTELIGWLARRFL